MSALPTDVRTPTRRLWSGWRIGCCLLVACCPPMSLSYGESSADAPFQFVDVTQQSGIGFRHTDGGTGEHYIVEYVSAGCATFDFDQDGDLDIYYLNGRDPVDSRRGARETTVNKLYRNDGNWRFKDVTRAAGVGDQSHGLGVAVGDYDNDGDQDLYLNNLGPNRLYRNNGDGTFSDVTEQAGVENGDRVGAGVCFLDADQDGHLDLYVANYLEFSFDKRVRRTMKGFDVYASPLDYAPDVDVLYRNNGDGTFRDVSSESGIAEHVGYGMGVVCVDFDRDGDTDILVGNDVGRNFFFRNDGRGFFQEIGLAAGFAYDGSGAIQGTMGVEAGDYDNDGFSDIHVTSYQNELSTLYRNVNGAILEDVTSRTGAGRGTRSQVTWGNALVDLDNDGYRDLFMACGHLYDNVEQFDDRTTYRAENMILANQQGRRFRDVTRSSGPGIRVKRSSRGACFDDLDGDGDIDIVVLNSRQEPTLLRNDSVTLNHWLQIRLVGTHTNRDAVGSRVELYAGELRQTCEVHSGRGYQSHFGSILHFGLAGRQQADRIVVHWLGGKSQTLHDVTADQRLVIREP